MTQPPLVSARDGLLIAKPLDFEPFVKVTYLLDRLVEHESEWTDFQVARRDLAASALVNPENVFFEVWQEGNLVGLVVFTRITPHADALFHAVFFDGKLRNVLGKRELLVRCMAMGFQLFDLQVLRMEAPDDAFALIDFARKKLGFRFEGEGRILKQRRAEPYGHLKVRRWIEHTPSSWEAFWGSRKYRAVLRKGQWRDLILLSLTREEFGSYLREAFSWGSSTPSSEVPQLPSRPSPKI